MSVVSLLAMPRAEGLFRRAVAQSGSGHFALQPATATKVAQALAERLGVPLTRDALAGVEPAVLVAAQQALSQEVQATPDPARWGEIVVNAMAFEPTVDGNVLPALPVRAVQAGAGAEVDLLIGTNTDEHALFLVPSGVVDVVDENVLGMLVGAYGLTPDALGPYRSASPAATPGELLVAVSTDWFFRLPALRLAEARQGAPGSTHVYEFAWPSPQFGGRLGACHALEVPFVFDTLQAPGSEALGGDAAPQELADVVHRAWVDFVVTGEPGWPAYDVTGRPVQVFGTLTAVTPDPRGDQRRVWEGVRV